MPKISKLLLIFPLILLLGMSSGCFLYYRPDIQQGNILTEDMLTQLKPGMSRRQVRYVLGTPLVNDPFHAERWDYPYYLQKTMDGEILQRIVTIIFQGDTVVEVRNLPAAPDPKPNPDQESRLSNLRNSAGHDG